MPMIGSGGAICLNQAEAYAELTPGLGRVILQRGAAETGSASSQVLSTARMLANDSNRLKDEVGKFLRTVRAG